VFLLQTEKDNLKGSIKETKKKVDMIKKFKQIKKEQKETVSVYIDIERQARRHESNYIHEGQISGLQELFHF
jgi:hypothetical protein